MRAVQGAVQGTRCLLKLNFSLAIKSRSNGDPYYGIQYYELYTMKWPVECFEEKSLSFVRELSHSIAYWLIAHWLMA